MSQVFIVRGCASDPADAVGEQVATLWQKAGFAEIVEARDLAALKLHVGEPGTKTYTSPAIVTALVGCMGANGARPFLTDTCVLYRSPRDNAVTHAQVARDHGFGHEVVGAPFISADGLDGTDEIELPLEGGKHFESVHLAAGVLHARSMIVLSHATGHLGTGLGGALKNLGMGCASKKSKLRQHHGQQPRIAAKKCTGCGACAEWCPADAITVEDVASIDGDLCIGCGECIAVCLDGAVKFGWGIMGGELQERVVEHAAALIRHKPGRIGYITAAQNITKNCDCLGRDEKPLLDDIGLLASRDPVAIDRAVLDLVQQRAGRSLESMSYPRVDGSVQLRHAETMGLGPGEYDLVEV